MGLIEPAWYRDPQWLQREHEQLFGCCWIFAGLLFELDGNGHRVMTIGATEIIVQRDSGGRPRAFLNVCSHRHAQLSPIGLHGGPLRCPYHGWVYDRAGVPVGIPQPQAFAAVTADPQAHRLTEFACEAAGQFVFVRLSEQGPSLADYLGDEYAFLSRASSGSDRVLDEFEAPVSANWKVIIENALEGYHVPAVHGQTFMQVDGMQRGIEVPVDVFDHPLHSSMTHAAAPAWLARFDRSMAPKIGRWPWRFDHYTHHHVFPNLTVTSFLGYSFHVQRFDPIDATSTRVHSRTLGAPFEGQTEVGAKLIERIYADGHAFTHRVFDEDGAICRRVQAGLAQARRRAVLGDGLEQRVAHFQRAYAQIMADATGAERGCAADAQRGKI
ncbi:MAG: aromatic ring-hydroxylating dioxygenase subunit alpha [Burkholderiales bacterium]|nr:aromatic ring-hydroxylating dioxygenase subunit alpha [Burkholderiales bacterium]